MNSEGKGPLEVDAAAPEDDDDDDVDGTEDGGEVAGVEDEVEG